MAKSDSYLKMTGDDLRAARVLTLAVKFFGTSAPVSSSTIAAELYPGLDDQSFKRQFLRDRELLSTFGMIIREAGSEAVDTLWQVDEEASYVQGSGLGPNEARMLYILCHDMAYDQAFPYRDELRMALAKISRMYRGETIASPDHTTPAQHKLLAVLVSCLSNHHGVAVTYTDAQGATSNRTLALLGSFGLRDHTYFVASRAENKGTLIPDSVRTYRLDRFVSARELPRITYQVPLDFDVADYQRLSFQIGDAQGTARFSIPTEPDNHLAQAMAAQGTAHQQDDQRVWDVSYSDTRAAAAWAIANNMTPLDPPELHTAWKDLLEQASHTSRYDASLVGAYDGERVAVAPRRPGRVGSVTVARQLVALATSLTREGEVITAQNIASTLGVSYDEARHLIALVSLGSGESIDYLPVILGDEDEEVSLMEGASLAARRIRLTRAETIALTTALAELGVARDDPLVQTLDRCYASPSFSLEDIRSSLEETGPSDEKVLLRQCSLAISEGQGLSFSYHPVSGCTPSRRRVVPQMLRRGDAVWYLDAYDLVRRDMRIFRLDRMSDLDLVPAPAIEVRPKTKTAKSMVVVRFDEQWPLELFEWHDTQVLSREDGTTVMRVPYYGGLWLIRHLAACAQAVRIDDEAISAQVQAYAAEVLAH